MSGRSTFWIHDVKLARTQSGEVLMLDEGPGQPRELTYRGRSWLSVQHDHTAKVGDERVLFYAPFASGGSAPRRPGRGQRGIHPEPRCMYGVSRTGAIWCWPWPTRGMLLTVSAALPFGLPEVQGLGRTPRPPGT